MKHLAKGPAIPLLAAALLLVVTATHGTVVESRNLTELTDLAERIFVGRVIGLSDDLSPENIPYTTITFEVITSIKGGLTEGSTFAYNQFGLLAPRPVGTDDKKLMVALVEGMPRYAVGEEAMVFLYYAAPMTGLCTSVGLAQGKFTIADGKIYNVLDNDGLFAGMALDVSRLTRGEAQMLAQESGPVDADTFINLVARGVNEGLFDDGE